jgi:hypothetical protein
MEVAAAAFGERNARPDALESREWTIYLSEATVGSLQAAHRRRPPTRLSRMGADGGRKVPPAHEQERVVKS